MCTKRMIYHHCSMQRQFHTGPAKQYSSNILATNIIILALTVEELLDERQQSSFDIFGSRREKGSSVLP